MRSGHSRAKGTDVIPKDLFRFKDLEAGRTLENDVVMILRNIPVDLISGDDALRIPWRTHAYRTSVSVERMCTCARLRDGSALAICVCGRQCACRVKQFSTVL